MNKFFYLLCCLFGAVWVLMAQAPQAFNYQAVIRNKAGNLLKSQQLELQISILENSPQGTAVYQETHSVKSSNAGTISLQVGKGMPLQGKFENINWGSGKEYYIHTVFTLNHETIDLGAVQILSVPYALYAQHSGEKHDLVLDGDSLRIKGGGKGVILPTGSFSGSSDTCLWKQEGLATATYTGSMALKTADGRNYLRAYSDMNNGHLRLNLSGQSSIEFDPGSIQMLPNTDDNRYRTRLLAGDTQGSLELYSTDNNYFIANAYGLSHFDKKGNRLTLLGGGNEKSGFLFTYDTQGKVNTQIGVTGEGNNSGFIATNDPNGDDLIRLTTAVGSEGWQGYIGLYYKGNMVGNFYVKDNGQSILHTDLLYVNGSQLRSSTTNYTAGNLRSSSTYAPCYVSESTDQQITFRGTATLNNGIFTIVLPPNEAEKIQENTITVQITPLSTSSKGLAVVKKEKTSFTVAELMNGTGSYDFDWTLTALRKEDPQLRSSHAIGTAGAAPIQDKRNIQTTSK